MGRHFIGGRKPDARIMVVEVHLKLADHTPLVEALQYPIFIIEVCIKREGEDGAINLYYQNKSCNVRVLIFHLF